MTAGLNIRTNIWRMSNNPDDVVGGAQITGSLQYQDVMSRIQANPEEQVILQQGLETERTYTMTCVPGTMDVRERDEVEVSKPTDHVYYGLRFRIVGVRYADHNPRDPRNYLILQLTRSVRAHNNLRQ